jgi:hypothetical protein
MLKTSLHPVRFMITAVLLASLGANLQAAAPAAVSQKKAGDFQSLDTKTQSLKREVMDLNRDLFVLEEELLFPASTQLAVFVSMDVGKLFQLDSVQVKLDNEVVANYLYTPRESEALIRGGVQRLHLGNLRAGKHELVAFFTGKGPHDRDYRRGASLVFEKQTGPKYIELQIKDKEKKLQPEFVIKEW